MYAAGYSYQQRPSDSLFMGSYLQLQSIINVKLSIKSSPLQELMLIKVYPLRVSLLLYIQLPELHQPSG